MNMLAHGNGPQAGFILRLSAAGCGQARRKFVRGRSGGRGVSTNPENTARRGDAGTWIEG
jgi:hypothetical protein